MYSNYYQPYGGQQIVRVNGEAGARSYQMMPNSSALLLDENQPVVWLAQTDGAGYKTVTPYTISAYQAPETDLEKRVKRLEAMIRESHPASNEHGECHE